MKKDVTYDYLAKVLIIGDSGVGKTNMLLRFTENNFMTSHLTTIGIDFKIKTINVDGKKIRLQIWDTAGQEKFKTITQTYYRGSMGIILTYSVTDLTSFQAITNWLQQIKMHANDNVVKIIVANKSDSPDRKVTFEEGKKMAQQYGLQYFQVSAKENINISEMFHFMGKEIKEKVLVNEVPIQPKSRTFTFVGKTEKQISKGSKKKCCQ